MFSKKDFVKKLDHKMKVKEDLHKEMSGSLDPLKGYTDRELKALESSYRKDPRVEDSKMARQIQKIKDKELYREKRAIADIQTSVLYPDSKDPNSHFSKVMEMKIDEYGLGNSPKARLAAAKLAELELEANEE